MPDYIEELYDNNDDCNDLVEQVDFQEELACLFAILQDENYVDEGLSQSIEDLRAGESALPDPSEFDSDKYPWYKSDDPDVIEVYAGVLGLLESE